MPVDKLEVHRRGLRHMAVSVFVVDRRRLLVQQRALAKYHTPGLWANTCCTHPHWQEHPDDCAARRLGEELGITDLPLRHRGRLEYRAEVGGGMIEHEVVDIYLGHSDPSLRIEPDPAEVQDTDWIDLDVLAGQAERKPERFTPWLRIYLKNHLRTIFGTLH
nr:isopentenyl-diphosphate Delta-isomerase [Jannaschia sp. S6380]